jgi:hypothetical protein
MCWSACSSVTGGRHSVLGWCKSRNFPSTTTQARSWVVAETLLVQERAFVSGLAAANLVVERLGHGKPADILQLVRYDMAIHRVHHLRTRRAHPMIEICCHLCLRSNYAQAMASL